MTIEITEKLSEADVLSEMGSLAHDILRSGETERGETDRQVVRLARLAFALAHNDPRGREYPGLRTAVLGDKLYLIDPKCREITPGILLAIDPETGFIRQAKACP